MVDHVSAHSWRLMPAPGPLFGRVAELEQITSALLQRRLVTVVGPPGVGKSRLATEIADRRPSEDHVGYAALAEVDHEDDLAATIATALGVPSEALRDAGEAAVPTPPCSLLIIDNAEHLRSGVATIVDRVIRHAAGPAILCTSRVPLEVASEQVVDLGPLEPSAAAELYGARAGMAGGGRRTAAVVSEICRRLDHLPLAVQIAASWARSLGDRDVLDRLEDALATEPVMAGTVAASLALLTAPERELFARLSVCSGSFDLEAARAVARPEGDVVAALVALVDHSLVVAEPDPDTARMRYRLLEPLRQQAAGLLDPAESADAKERHTRHFAKLARHGDRALRGPDLSAVRVLWRDEGNLRAAAAWARQQDPRAALELAVDLARYWEQRGRVHDARRQLESALAIVRDELTPQRRAAASHRLAVLAWRQHDYAAARSAYGEGLAVMRDLANPRGIARGLRGIALIDATTGRTREARAACDQSLALYRRLGDRVGEGWALSDLALIEFQEGRVAEGRACHRRALDVSGPDRPALLSVTGHLGVAYGAALTGEVGSHRQHLAIALDHLAAAGPAYADPDWLWAGSYLAASEGRARAALRLAGAADNLGRDGILSPEAIGALCARGVARARQRVGARAAARHAAQGARMSVAELMAEALAPPGSADRPLTARELEVADLAGRGLGNEEIARALSLSRRTVESHIEHCRHKLDLASRLELVAWAIERRLEQEPTESA